MFDVTLEQIIQSSDDPKVNCQSYAASNSYYNCVQLKFEKIFIDLIKCVPPWFTDDQRKVCQYKDNQVAKQIVMRQGYKDKVLGKSLFFFFIFSYNAKKTKMLLFLLSTYFRAPSEQPLFSVPKTLQDPEDNSVKQLSA